MPSDAAALIETLRAHPKACGMIDLRVADDGSRAFSTDIYDVWRDDPPHCVSGFRRWLVGACVEKCDELGIELPARCRESKQWLRVTGQFSYEVYPTFLAAMLAALERHDAQ